MLNSHLVDGFLGAIVGSLISVAAIFWQTKRAEEREARSVAMTLLWEIDDFYKLNIRNLRRALKDKDPNDLGFEVKSLTFRRFTVYEAAADKVGLFDPGLVQGVVGWYGSVSAYLDTIHDYGVTLERIQTGQRQLHNKAAELLRQIKASADSLVDITKTICEGLAKRAKASDYTFDAS
jgi:hypothetical protein